MSKEEQITMLIDKATEIQRIKTSPDREAEIENQLRIIRIKLEALGVITSEIFQSQ